MKNTKIYKIIEKINKKLMDNMIVADVYHTGLPGQVCVEILWGDWKHEHVRTKLLVQDMGGFYVGSQTIEEDGSDCYSAVHTFLFEV